MKKAGRHPSSLMVAVMLVTMAFTLTACAGNATVSPTAAPIAKSAPEVKLGKEYKIGVISYDYSDQQGQELKKYFSYLEKEFGVKFVYATAQPEEAQEIKAHEDLCAAGVNGILNLMWNKKAFEVGAQCKVYEAVILNTVLGKEAGPGDQGYDDVKLSPYYVGSVSPPLDYTIVGQTVARAAVDAKLDNLGLIGFPRFWIPALDKSLEAFDAAVKAAGKTVIDGNPDNSLGPDDAMRLNPMADVAAQLTTYLSANPKLQFIYAASSGMDLVYPTIVNAGLKGKVKLGVVGYNPNISVDALKDGSILIAANPVNAAQAAIGFAMLIDKLEGKAYADAPQYPTDVETNIVFIKSEADALTFNKLVLGDVPPVTSAELKSVMKTFNANATYAGLKTLAMENSDLTKLTAKRK